MSGSFSNGRRKKRDLSSSILLALVLVFLFGIPAFPLSIRKVLYNVVLTLIMAFAALAMDRDRKRMLYVALAAILIEWVAFFLDMTVLMTLSQTVLFLYFILVVIGLILQVATTKQVTARVIVESITGYLLMGIVFSLVIVVLTMNIPGVYASGGSVLVFDEKSAMLSDYLYYGFTTYTTLGYGDIVPIMPISKAISTMASVTGQIYLTVIIATLVGKFLSGRQDR